MEFVGCELQWGAGLSDRIGPGPAVVALVKLFYHLYIHTEWAEG